MGEPLMPTDYERGYQDGLAVLGMDKLLFAATALESAAHWIARSEGVGALVEADRRRLEKYVLTASEAIYSLERSLPPKEVA